MKKRKLTVCLLAGVLVLAVSAGAAYGSVNGYAAYKDGETLWEIDKRTMKCNIGGVDYSADLRKALGK